ncbi:MAG: PAS domain S-box protein [Actinomycetota bacterium]
MDGPERFVEDLISAGPVLIFRRRVNEVATYVSPNVTDILGYPLEEIVDVPDFWLAHIHPDDLEQFRAEADSAWRSKAHELKRAYRFLHKDGAYRWLQTTVRFEYDDAGEPVAVVGYGLDVTEQKRVEEELRQSEERTRAVLHAALEAFVSIDAQGVITEWSAQAESIFGWSRREAIGRTLADTIVPEQHRAAHRHGLEHFLATGEGPLLDKRIEVTALRRDGSEFPVELTITAVRTSDSYVFHALVHDITERTRTQQELDRIYQMSPDLLCVANFDGYFLRLNPEWTRALGYTLDDLTARPFLDFVHPDDVQTTLDEMKTLATGAQTLSFENRYRCKDGTYKWMLWNALPVPEERLIYAAARDITERKEAEEEIRGAREEADRANRAKSEFLARMSHELRTPLNAILGFGQLLEMDPLRPQERESVEQILKAGQHLLELINEVLDIARIEEGKISLSIEPVRVSDALGDALDLAKPLAAQRGVHLDTGDAPLCDRHIMADRQRLKQVLLNLLANGIKYNHEGGSVIVSCRAEGERLRIRVADTGPGIPRDQMGKLFVPFERLGMDQSEVEGTGIGLALSKRLVDLMGGEIGAESTVGVGSTFWVEFDLAEDAVGAESDVGGAAHAVEALRERVVLYIEDNLSNMRLVERIIARRPHVRLLAAMQGGLGADLAREHRPDLVLLDVHLPDTRGEEVLAHLRQDPATAEIPVVVISAEATAPKIERFLAAGARAYLTKPLDVARFLEVLDEVLGQGTDGS